MHSARGILPTTSFARRPEGDKQHTCSATTDKAALRAPNVKQPIGSAGAAGAKSRPP